MCAPIPTVATNANIQGEQVFFLTFVHFYISKCNILKFEESFD